MTMTTSTSTSTSTSTRLAEIISAIQSGSLNGTGYKGWELFGPGWKAVKNYNLDHEQGEHESPDIGGFVQTGPSRFVVRYAEAYPYPCGYDCCGTEDTGEALVLLE